jgi:hypothetical protein
MALGRRNRSQNGSQLEQSVAASDLQTMDQQRDEFTKDAMDRDEYLDKLTDHGLDSHTAELLDNMLSPDFVMSRISEAEKDEMKWLVRLEAEKIKAMHPPQNSPVSGDRRKMLYDDEDAQLEPLSDQQKQMLDMAVWDVFFRIARSVGGWQQEELSSQYKVSRVEDEQGDDGGRLGGLFS